MAKLKLGPIADEKPVKITAELPAATYPVLVAYGEALGCETGQRLEPAQLVGPMLNRFMATDRVFAKARRSGLPTLQRPVTPAASESAQDSEIA